MSITVTLTADNADALRGELRAFLEDTQADASGMARVTVAEFQGLVAQLREAECAVDYYRTEADHLREQLDAAKRDGGAWHLVGEAQQKANEAADVARIYGARLQADGYDLAKVREASRVVRPHSEAIPLGAREASEQLDAAKRDGGAWHLVGEAQQRANEFTDLAKIYGARLEAEGYDLARVRATSRVARPHSEAIPLGAREASGCKGVAS